MASYLQLPNLYTAQTEQLAAEAHHSATVDILSSDMIPSLQINHPSRTAIVLRQAKLWLSGRPQIIKSQHIRMCNGTCADRGVVPASGGKDRWYLLICARDTKVQQPTDRKHHGILWYCRLLGLWLRSGLTQLGV